MKIKHVNGTYWNEDTDCFGPECEATKYDSVYAMPDLIECNDCTELKIFISTSINTKFFPTQDPKADALASVEV